MVMFLYFFPRDLGVHLLLCSGILAMHYNTVAAWRGRN
jgi:hypothetical protein